MQKIDALETEQYFFYISLSVVLVSSKPQETAMLCPLLQDQKAQEFTDKTSVGTGTHCHSKEWILMAEPLVSRGSL